MEIAKTLGAIRDRIAQAAERSGRPPSDVHLLAISKKQPLIGIREAYALGQRDFGENYAQELAEKALALADLGEIHWHFVGHLQRNKAKLVSPLCALVHTLDSVDLAQELLRRSDRPKVRGLVEVNLGGEAQKSGVAPDAVAPLCAELLALPHLSLEGLMCLPPASHDPRAYFRALRNLRDDLEQRLAVALPELSMGMSEDFEVAIEEGATWVRIGTALFGPRSSSASA